MDTHSLPVLIDSFGRRIDYLRVSVTDRCNFRCVYCMPEEGTEVSPRDELLTTDELIRVVSIAVREGIRKVRLTGGEPLVNKEILRIVRGIAECGVDDLSLTTNGYLLPELAQPLKAAGLHRVNISLDTLQEERFKSLARRGSLSPVLEGIAASQRAGLGPIKLNCVVMRGLNDDEAVDFARWTLTEDIHIRFIELMPIRWNLDDTAPADSRSAHPSLHLIQLKTATTGMLSDADMRRRFVAAHETMKLIEQALGPLEPAEIKTNGPARSYRLRGGRGTVGFISQISSDLCLNCNRIRLTADGSLRPCLMSDGEIDLRSALRAGAADSDLAELFRGVVATKPERHYLAEGQRVTGRGMSQLGG